MMTSRLFAACNFVLVLGMCILTSDEANAAGEPKLDSASQMVQITPIEGKLSDKLTARQDACVEERLANGFLPITRPADIIAINASAANLSNNYVLTTDIDYNESKRAFQQVGALSNSSYAAFTGTFDGCYHTISNAKATFLTSSTTVDSGRAGFFWEVGSSGRVENLALLNTQFSFQQGPSGVEPRFGGMVAAILYGTVSNVQVNGGRLDCVLRNAQGVVVKAGSWCGGIAGKVGSLSPVVQGGVLVSLKQGLISSSNSSAEVVGGSTLGGLVGVFYGRIENSEASGAIRGGSELGGLVGSLRTTFSVSNGTQIPRDFWPSIYRSKSHSSINVQVDLIESILNSYGGLVGNGSINEGLTIDESYADGTINIPSSWATTLLPRSGTPIANWGYLGGLVGSANNIHVKDSYSRSNISAVGTPKVGGLVGLLSGEVVEIKSSYYSGTATAVSPRGIVGNNSAPYTCGAAPFNSFWNSSLLSGGSYCGSALTAAQMASASAFTSAGWLPTIWNFSGPTPRLINTP